MGKKSGKSDIMKKDKALDKKMTPQQMREDIKADKKELAKKVKSGKKK